MNLQDDLKALVDKFARFRNAYDTLKKENSAQKELLRAQEKELETTRILSARNQKRVKELLTALNNVKEHKIWIDRANEENKYLRESNEQLRRNYDDLLFSTNEQLERARREHVQQIQKLEDEMEMMRTQIAILDDKYQEDMKTLEEKHRRDLNDCTLHYKNQLQNVNTKLAELEEEKIAFTSNAKKKTAAKNSQNKTRVVNVSRSQRQHSSQLFGWPEMDFIASDREPPVPGGQSKSKTPKGSKKRKLYNNTSTSPIDVLL